MPDKEAISDEIVLRATVENVQSQMITHLASLEDLTSFLRNQIYVSKSLTIKEQEELS